MTEATAKSSPRLYNYLGIVLAVACFEGLYLASRYNYLLFHSLAELFSILVACSIFLFAWNSRRFMDSEYVLYMGIGYLFVGALDLLHTLAYPGMDAFHSSGGNLSTQLWIAARYVQSVSIFLAVLLIGRKVRATFVLGAYGVAFAVLLGSIFYWKVFPTCVIDGQGFTPFKNASENAVSVILLGAMTLMFRKREDFDPRVFWLLVAAILVTVFSQLAFAFHVVLPGLRGSLGYFLKVASFYLVYKAIIETGLVRPYDLLFRKLKLSYETIEAKNTELAERHRQLREAYEELEREFQSVVDVQLSLLPARNPEIPGFQVATHYKPAKRASGDYFDFFCLPENRWGILVADVSGHGAPAAVVMAMTRVLAHNSDRYTPPGEVLTQLNNNLCRNILPERFVTALYGVLDPATRSFIFASAGHPRPVCFDPSRGEAEMLEVDNGLPLGFELNAQYPVSSVVLQPGGVLMLYTDGVTEALDPAGRQFGEKGLLNVLATNCNGDADNLRDAIVNYLQAHSSSVAMEDDITLLVIQALPKS